MQFKLFVFALMCTAIFAAPKRFQDTKSVLAEMEKDKFGSTMLSAVQMNLSVEAPEGDIMELIQEIIDQLNEKQAAADEKNRTVQANCDESIATLTQSIADTKATIKSTEESIAVNEGILANARTDLAQADQDYEETVEAIEQGTAKRETEHNRWIEEDYQNQVSIATLEEGVKLIQHMIHGVAFSQIKSRYDKVLEKLSDTESKHASLFKPLISSLTQLATKLNYDNVMKILELLNNIRLTIVEEREQGRIAEEQAQADWEALLSHLTSEKQRLTDKRSRLRALIESTELVLQQSRQSLENNKVFLENFEATLQSTQTTCQEEAVIYATETYERERELQILEELQQHLYERAQQVIEYVSSRYQ